MSNPEHPIKWAMTHIDLLAERFGGQTLSCNDEFFAEASNLMKQSEPVFIEDKYTDRGKWMDGWETRRRRSDGFDWCIVRLGIAGRIRAIDVNTTFFKGNAPDAMSIEACYAPDDPALLNADQWEWFTLIESKKIKPHSHNLFELTDSRSWTHLRLNIFPDGGVARLRVYGEPRVDWSKLLPNELVDLAACANGGRALACSDMFFSPMNNLIAPNRGKNMGDGWETRRRRGPGHDWLIVKLACPGRLKRVLIDTLHFKGNFPDSFVLEAIHSITDDLTDDAMEWTSVIASTKLMPHTEHFYQEELLEQETPFTHVRLSIFPDGGVSRMRVFGYPVVDTEIQD
ncbi:allantoicase [Ketobacter sp. MCCC 1A13808]|uniref:allantoicase n=1 Tax=Ketobacter sp. MCCC 1A13808 TaxID=2602738 RepID=UPI0012EC44D0|nr:allantoicase [Ketobacter sp. MCCC 1A13808]MVF12064.1 allantoicase [Ketobacter sp. MCCC 1A13808]